MDSHCGFHVRQVLESDIITDSLHVWVQIVAFR